MMLPISGKRIAADAQDIAADDFLNLFVAITALNKNDSEQRPVGPGNTVVLIFSHGSIGTGSGPELFKYAAVCGIFSVKSQSVQSVTVVGAECVAKSYPTFWDEFERISVR